MNNELGDEIVRLNCSNPLATFLTAKHPVYFQLKFCQNITQEVADYRNLIGFPDW